MKIKKVAQTPGVIATVSTSKIDSDKDTYSCNYLNDNAVVVSPTEPSDGKVWLERGKNLIDKNYFLAGYSILGDTGLESVFPSCGCGTNYIEVKPNTSYVLSVNTNISALRLSEYTENKTHIQRLQIENSKILMIKTSSKTKYLRWSLNYNDNDNATLDILNNLDLILEKSPKKIHTKNDNGVYEEFYSEENREVYSTSEQRIGTWIDGKPLYRQVFSGLQCPNNNVGHFGGILRNTDKIIRIEGIMKTSNTSSDEIYPTIFGRYEANGMSLNLNQYSGALFLVATKDFSANTCDVVVEYTKITD